MRNAPREWFVVFRFHSSLRRPTRDRRSILRCKLYPAAVARQQTSRFQRRRYLREKKASSIERACPSNLYTLDFIVCV